MKFKLKKREAEKQLLRGAVLFFGLFYFSNKYFKNELTSDNVRYTVLVIISVVIVLITTNSYIRKKKKITLELSDSFLKCQNYSGKINKNDILKFELLHGHVSSFALIKLKMKPKFKFYQFRNRYLNYIHGTPYLINLDKIEGDPSNIFQALNEWKKENSL
jgi:hypothetical protein